MKKEICPTCKREKRDGYSKSIYEAGRKEAIELISHKLETEFVGEARPDGIGYVSWQDIKAFLESLLNQNEP